MAVLSKWDFGATEMASSCAPTFRGAVGVCIRDGLLQRARDGQPGAHGVSAQSPDLRRGPLFCHAPTEACSHLPSRRHATFLSRPRVEGFSRRAHCFWVCTTFAAQGRRSLALLSFECFVGSLSSALIQLDAVSSKLPFPISDPACRALCRRLAAPDLDNGALRGTSDLLAPSVHHPRLALSAFVAAPKHPAGSDVGTHDSRCSRGDDCSSRCRGRCPCSSRAALAARQSRTRRDLA